MLTLAMFVVCTHALYLHKIGTNMSRKVSRKLLYSHPQTHLLKVFFASKFNWMWKETTVFHTSGQQMVNPRVRRTSGFHFLTTSVENSYPRMSGSFMLSHKVSTLAKIYLNNKTSFASQSNNFSECDRPDSINMMNKQKDLSTLIKLRFWIIYVSNMTEINM